MPATGAPSTLATNGTVRLAIDSYLRDATEVDVDALCDGEDVFVAGILEHIEEAGVHSGDSACSMPPFSLSDDIIAELEKQTAAMALALGVVGLMNVQRRADSCRSEPGSCRRRRRLPSCSAQGR